MSKGTNYSGKLYNGKIEKVDPDVVKEKIGNTSIDVSELAAFLGKYGKRAHEQTEKNIRRKIIAICQKSEGLLSDSDFKENNKYVFKPEYHGFIIPLIDSTYLLEGKNKRKLKVRNELLEDLLVNIETYMTNEDLEIMKTNPAYYNAKLESLLSSAINVQLIQLIREVFHADEVMRYQEMKQVLDTLVELNQKITVNNAHIESAKMVFGVAHEEEEDGRYRKALMQADNIGDFLVHLLSLKVKGKRYEFLSEEEKLTYPALWTMTKIYECEMNYATQAGKDLVEMDIAIGNQERFKEILKKAKQVFDLHDPYENIMFNNVIKQAMACYAMPYVSENDYVQMVRFIESAMAENKWDLLDKFWNEDEWNSPLLQEFRRIRSLRGVNGKPDIL